MVRLAQLESELRVQQELLALGRLGRLVQLVLAQLARQALGK